MIYNQRQVFILGTIKEKKSIQVSEVRKTFHVSDMTVRRDLTGLENAGLIVRRFGGAFSPSLDDQLFRFDEKLNINRNNKEMLCKIAATEIEENDVLFIDSGSTLYYLANHIIKFENLRIITNSLPVVAALSGAPKFNVTLLGGEYDYGRQAVFGSLTLKIIEDFHCHKAFIGADGISIKHGLSSYYDKEAAISARILESSDKVFVVADSSKIEKDAYIKYAPIEKVSAIITDNGISPEIIKIYIKNKITIRTN